MNKRNILALVADMLCQSSAIFARRTGNDWRYPANWTGEERGEFYRQYMLWAHNGDEDKVDEEIKSHVFDYEYGPPDWAVASMLADLIKDASDVATKAAV